MTEYSLPWPGTTLGHAGPYAVGGAGAPGWWDKWGVEARAGGRLSQVALAGIGVFYCVDDQLECTEAADTTSVDVDEGSALIDGAIYWNDTDPVNVPIPAAAGAGDSRVDLIVARKNYQEAVTYTPGGGAPTVPFRETHITVIRGTEAVGPVAPTVTQDVTRATYWDIPLCSVQVDDAGALTLLTDLREYVDAETKTAFAQASNGYNGTDAVDIPVTWPIGPNFLPAVVLPDSKSALMTCAWQVPADYISGLTMRSVVAKDVAGAGNIYANSFAFNAACGEDIATHQASTAQSAIAMVTDQWTCIDPLVLTTPTVGDFVYTRLVRDAIDALDTIGDVVYGLGFTFTYLGWRR